MPSEFDLEMTDRLLTTTRSVRLRLDLTRPVAVATVRECLAIALQAATGGDTQRWRWMIVADAGRRAAIGEIYARSFREILASGEHAPAERPAPSGAHDDPTEAAYHRRFSADAGAKRRLMRSVEFLIDHLAEVPIHLIACVIGRVEADATPHWVSAQYGSVYPAVWNLQLALRSRGLGSCITGAHLAHEREVAAVLEVPYEQVMQVCLLPIAYYTGHSFGAARRRPLDDVVFVDRFDRRSLDADGW